MAPEPQQRSTTTGWQRWSRPRRPVPGARSQQPRGHAHERLGAAARNEHAGRHGDPQPAELGPAEDVLERLARDAAGDHRLHLAGRRPPRRGAVAPRPRRTRSPPRAGAPRPLALLLRTRLGRPRRLLSRRERRNPGTVLAEASPARLRLGRNGEVAPPEAHHGEARQSERHGQRESPQEGRRRTRQGRRARG